jgi:hypothetical protein
LRGVGYVQSRDVLHGDIKPQNVLRIVEDGPGGSQCVRYVLADFGLARTSRCFAMMTKQEVFTLWYRAPELLLGGSYGPEADLWAIGCTVYEILTTRPLFPGDSVVDALFRIFRTFGTPTDTTWPDLSMYPQYKANFPVWQGDTKIVRKILSDRLPAPDDQEAFRFVMSLLSLNPRGRKTAEQALEDPWLSAERQETLVAQCLLAPPAEPIRDCVTTLLAREAPPTGSPLRATTLARREMALTFLTRALRPITSEGEKLGRRDRVLGLAVQLYGECQSQRELTTHQDVLYAGACLFIASELLEDGRVSPAGIVSALRPPGNGSVDVSDRTNHLLLEAAVSDALLCHGTDLYVATSYDVLEALLEDAKAKKDVREAARTLLQCSYDACLGDRYRPRLIALLCESLAYASVEQPFPHALLMRTLDAEELKAALKLLGANLASLWLVGAEGSRSFTASSAEARGAAERGKPGDLERLLSKTRVLATLLGLA